jgi:hypothetical protein
LRLFGLELPEVARDRGSFQRGISSLFKISDVEAWRSASTSSAATLRKPKRSATAFRLRMKNGKLSTSVPSRSKMTRE